VLGGIPLLPLSIIFLSGDDGTEVGKWLLLSGAIWGTGVALLDGEFVVERRAP